MNVSDPGLKLMLSLDTLVSLAHHDPLTRATGLLSLVSLADEPVSEKADIVITSLSDLHVPVVLVLTILSYQLINVGCFGDNRGIDGAVNGHVCVL